MSLSYVQRFGTSKCSMNVKMWKATSLDFAVAEELFGWKWWSYFGRPVRSHPEYPKEMRVRRFYPPLESLCDQWQDHFKRNPHEPAIGDEPLCYSYESMNGPHDVPHFSGHRDACEDMEREIAKRGLFEKYFDFLAQQTRAKRQNGTINEKKRHFAKCEDRCLAALATVGSKYVQIGEPNIGEAG